ncbi:hypothetical protein M8C21_010322 [Ambrosia artemisiifolia]|uniref:WRKY domain-containing protein n=1 Tax=Ambrosia artemisiifolia TaxID=4212 RepID=A0AAD5CGI3_AMBAR|nr:hypothetical protein M8C21_010322 [Ambrosia artemisiifolia]
MDVDWDLQAVVRGCCSATATTEPPESCTQQKSTFYEDNNNNNNIDVLTFSEDLFQPRNDINSIEKFMNDLYNCNPLQFTNLQQQQQTLPHQSLPISGFSFLGEHQEPPYNHHYHHHQQQVKQFQVKQQALGISRCTTTHAHGAKKIKKRKNQNKKICQVPAEGSPPDLWSWRKYGQKPIKGSPYPRGYYKCSTLKGCLARKQVERNRSDPGMLIITYTGEHTHPVPTQVNSLSDSIRNKTTTSGDGDTGNNPTPSPTSSPVASLPSVMDKTDDIDDDNNFDISGLVVDGETFDGFDDLVGSAVGDMFSDHCAAATADPTFPWLPNNLPPQPPLLPAGIDF